MIVVDNNIICYYYIEGKYTSLVEKLYEKDPGWVVPSIWKSEFCNVLARYFRQKILSFQEVTSILNEAELLFYEKEYTIPSSDIMELVRECDCSAYDCEYVALAHYLKVPLLTMDKKILKSFHMTTKSLEDYLR